MCAALHMPANNMFDTTIALFISFSKNRVNVTKKNKSH